MSILNTVRAQVERQLQRKAAGLVNDAIPQAIPQNIAEPLRKAAGAVFSGDMAGAQQQSRMAMAEAGRVARNLAAQAAGQAPLAAVREMGRGLSGGPEGPARPVSPASRGVVSDYPGSLPFGGLTQDRAIQLFNESANTPRALASLWHIAITERVFSRAAPRGISRMLNLLAIDCNFEPITLTGDSVALGAAMIDNLTGVDRVQVSITTYDDDRGSITRWFDGKRDQAARMDGTFGLPADYLIGLTITQMDVLGQSDPSERVVHRLLVRPESLSKDLNRRTHELEEIQLRFVEFDTCIRP